MEDDMKKNSATQTNKSKNNNIFKMEDNLNFFFEGSWPQKNNATKNN
jgi:hypothetical protein